MNIIIAITRNTNPRKGMKGFTTFPGAGKVRGMKLPIARPSKSIPTI